MGCRICVTVRLPVKQGAEKNVLANKCKHSLAVTSLFNLPDVLAADEYPHHENIIVTEIIIKLIRWVPRGPESCKK